MTSLNFCGFVFPQQHPIFCTFSSAVCGFKTAMLQIQFILVSTWYTTVPLPLYYYYYYYIKKNLLHNGSLWQMRMWSHRIKNVRCPSFFLLFQVISVTLRLFFYIFYCLKLSSSLDVISLLFFFGILKRNSYLYVLKGFKSENEGEFFFCGKNGTFCWISNHGCS